MGGGFGGGFGGFGNIRRTGGMKQMPRSTMKRSALKRGAIRNKSFGGFRRGGNVRYPTKRA